MSDNTFWICFWIIALFVIASLFGSLGYVVINHKKIEQQMYEKCISVGNQYIQGNCVIGKHN